jgi:hypothetical protein
MEELVCRLFAQSVLMLGALLFMLLGALGISVDSWIMGAALIGLGLGFGRAALRI